MTTQQIITTMVGGFIFPFLLQIVWGQFTGNYGLIGGALSAGFIVGTTWVLNHGIATHFVIQGAGAAPWIDMAWAAAFGCFTESIVTGGAKASVGKALPMILCAVIGGVIGGFIISCATP